MVQHIIDRLRLDHHRSPLNKVTFSAYRQYAGGGSDKCIIGVDISNAWDAPPGTYNWELWEQDDSGDVSAYWSDDDDRIAGGTFIIKPRPATLTVWPIDKIYGEDGKVIQYKYTIDGLVPNDNPEDVVKNVYSAQEGTAEAQSLQDNHKATMISHAQGVIGEYVYGSKINCYDLTLPSTPATFNIRHVNLQDLTVSFGNKTSKVYDGLNGEDFSRNPKFTYNNIPLTLDEGIDYNLAWKKAGTNTTYRAPNIAGNYTAVIKAPSNQTNTINEHTGFNFTVEKKPITIVPKDQSFTFDGTTKAKTKPADCGEEGYSEVLSGGKDGDTYKAVGLAETDNMTDFALTIGDNSEDDLMLSTWVADVNDADGDGDKTEKIEASKDITLDKDSIKIIRTAESTGASADPSLVNIPTGADVTDCYDITIASEPGKLTIAPKESATSEAGADKETKYFAKIEDVTVTYDGNKKSLGAVIYKNAEGTVFEAKANELTVEYKYGDGEWTTKMPSFTDAGTYEIEYRIAHGADYNNGYPNEDERCYDLLFAETTGTATLTIEGKPQDDATVSVENNKWTYGDGIKDVITVKDKDGTDITKKTDFTGNKTITYRYIVDPYPSIDEISDELKNNTADWKELNLSDSSDIPTGTYWLEATIPAYDNYAETKVYTQFTVGKKNIKVGINRFTQTYADNYTSDDYNDQDVLDQSTKYTYDGVVGDDDPLGDTPSPDSSGSYSDVKLVETETGKKLEFANEFSGDEDVFDNYVITVVDQIGEGDDAIITDGAITVNPVDITGENIYTTFAKSLAPYHYNDKESVYEWTGEAVGPQLSKIDLLLTRGGSDTLSPDKQAADGDYSYEYFKINGSLVTSLGKECPKEKGSYVLVISGNNVEPGSDKEARNESAKVYGQTEIKFTITDHIYVLKIGAKDRTYEFGNTSVELDFDNAKLFEYNNLTGKYDREITGELKTAVLGDDNVKNMTAEMADDDAGQNKEVTINDNKLSIELANTDYTNYKVVLQCSEGEGNECKAKVNIAKADLSNTETNPTALTIGEKTSASWQYGDYDATKAKLALSRGVQSKTVDGKEQKDTSNDDVTITYYYSKALLDATEFAEVSTGEDYKIGTSLEEVENWIKTLATGKYQIVAVISEGTNYNTITTAPIKITVNKRNITITAKEQYRYYMDNKVPNLDESSSDYTVTHVKDDKTVVTDKVFAAEGETLATVITGAPLCDGVTDERTQDVAEFDIVKGELKVADAYASNYELTFVPNKFKILPLPLDNVYDEEYPQIAESKGFKVEVRLEKDEYIYDGTEKSPSFTVVYTRTVNGVNESYTVPQEQYQNYYTKDGEDKQSSHKLPGMYNVYVYRANGMNNVKEDTIARGIFEIRKIPVTVDITMTAGDRSYDGTTDIKDATYTAILAYKTDEDGSYAPVPDTPKFVELEKKFIQGEEGDAEYNELLDALVLPSANAGTYSLGLGENDISVADLDEYFAGLIDDDTYEYFIDDVIYAGDYTVNKAEITPTVTDIEPVEYNGKYQNPEVTVSFSLEGSEENLIKESDYVVTYKSNKNVTKGENDYAVATISASKDGNFVFEPVVKNFKITPKTVTLTSNYSLEDKEYDQSEEMKVIGDYEVTGIIDEETVEVRITVDEDGEYELADEEYLVEVEDANAGEKEAVIFASLDGKDADNYVLEVKYADEDKDDDLKTGALDNDEALLGRLAYDTVPIYLDGQILPKELEVTSTLALVDKVYDESTKMSVKGAAEISGVLDGDDVTLSGATAPYVNVEKADAGNKTYTFTLSLAGEDKDNYKLDKETVIAKGKITPAPTISSTGIYCAQNSPSIKAGMNITKSSPDVVVEYRWEVYNTKCTQAGWVEVASWSTSKQWIDYKPSLPGEYLVVCHARIKGYPKSEITKVIGVPFTMPVIKATCQMPSDGKYLIGFETYANADVKYSYEILMLDCNLLAAGKDPWVYTTGKKTSKNNSFWTTWDPAPGYYWTLFRVYDEYGNIVDEQCYGFSNVN